MTITNKLQQQDLDRLLKPYLPVFKIKNMVELSINDSANIYIETFDKGYQPLKEYNKTNTRLSLQISNEQISLLARTLAGIYGQKFGQEDRYLYALLPDKPYRFTFAKINNSGHIALSIRKLTTAAIDIGSFGFSDAEEKHLMTDISSYKNIVIAGATGSGKTTLMNSCLQYIDDNDRIISVQDIPELTIKVKNHIPFMFQSNISTTDLYAESANMLNAICRLNPTRIILGELNIYNSLAMLNAMNTGHHGCLITMHANTAHDAINKISLNISMASSMTQDTAEKLIRDTVEVIYFLKRHKTAFQLERLKL